MFIFGYAPEFIALQLAHKAFVIKEWLSPSALPHEKLDDYPSDVSAAIAARPPTAADRALYAMTKWNFERNAAAQQHLDPESLDVLHSARAAVKARNPYSFAAVRVDTRVTLLKLTENDNLEHAYIELKPSRLLFYIHGGGHSTGHNRMCESTYLEVARRINANLFEASYHMCPEVSISKQIEEVYAAYRYALEKLGYKPSQIIVAGDSAGGNLAANLLFRLRDESSAAASATPPLPACAYLGSPWLDLTNSLESNRRNEKSDIMLRPNRMAMFNKHVHTQHPDEQSLRALSPLFQASKIGLMPMYLSVSADEIFYDGVMQFAEVCRSAGVTVELDNLKVFMPHCYQIFFEFSHAAADTIDRLVVFANKHLAAGEQ